MTSAHVVQYWQNPDRWNTGKHDIWATALLCPYDNLNTQPTQKLSDVITQVRALDTFSHVSAAREGDRAHCTQPSTQLAALRVWARLVGKYHVCAKDAHAQIQFLNIVRVIPILSIALSYLILPMTSQSARTYLGTSVYRRQWRGLA